MFIFKTKKFIRLTIISFVLSSIILNTFGLINYTSAASSNPQDQLEKWLYYRGMRACFDSGPDFSGIPGKTSGSISKDDINNGHWLPNGAGPPKKGFGYLAPSMDNGNDNDGTVNCSDGSIFVRGASAFGFDSSVSLFCAINRAMEKAGKSNFIRPSNAVNCESSEKFDVLGSNSSVWQEAVTQALSNEGSKDRPSFDLKGNSGPDYSYKALAYLIGKKSLEVFCGNGQSINQSATKNGNLSNKDIVSVDVVDDTGVVNRSLNYPLSNPNRDENSKVDDIYYGDDANNATDVTCADMAKLTRDNSNDYSDWAKLHLSDAKNNQQAPVKNDSDDSSSTNGDDKTSCGIEGIGWIVCPVMSFIGKINDAALGFLSSYFLNIDSSLVGDGTHAAWEKFRDLANVLFVIAFITIIYSQLTGAGITNYGVKKMLPKLIAVAILVNLSFILCQIAIDISNIVGSQISTFVGQTLPSGTTSESSGYSGIGGLSWYKTIIAGLAVGATALVAIGLLLAVGTTGLLALGMIVLILVARKAVIILLIVASPVAFAAYLLPNTESLFKKWWTTAKAMLFVYPIIGLVFGVGQLAAKVIVSSSSSDLLVQATALGVMVIPLFAVPVLLKSAMSATGQLGAVLGKGMNKANSRSVGNIKKGRSGEAIDAFNRSRQNKKFARRRGEGRLAQWGEKHEGSKVGSVAKWAGTRQKAFDENTLGQKLGGTRGAAIATQGMHKQLDEDVAAFSTTMTSQTPAELSTIMNSTKNSIAQRAAAASLIGKRGGQGDVNKAIDDLGKAYGAASTPKEREQISDIQKEFMSTVGSKLPQSMTGPSKGALSTGQFNGNLSNEILKSLEDGRYSGQSLASMHPKELDAVLNTLSSAKSSSSLTSQQLLQLATLKTSIADYRTASITQGKGMANEIAVPISSIERL